MWSKRAVFHGGPRRSTGAMRSDIELQSVPRYRSFNTRCIYGEVHIVRLGGDSQRRAKKLRREVRAVGPNQCPKLRVDLKSEKEITVPQRLKYRTVDLI